MKNDPMDMKSLPKLGSVSRSKKGSLFGIGNLNKEQLSRVPEDERKYANKDVASGRKQRRQQETKERNARIRERAEATRSRIAKTASGMSSRIQSARAEHEQRQITRYGEKANVYDARAAMLQSKANVTRQSKRIRGNSFNLGRALGMGGQSKKIRYTGGKWGENK
jgi:hypothetical protein